MNFSFSAPDIALPEAHEARGDGARDEPRLIIGPRKCRVSYALRSRCSLFLLRQHRDERHRDAISGQRRGLPFCKCSPSLDAQQEDALLFLVGRWLRASHARAQITREPRFFDFSFCFVNCQLFGIFRPIAVPRGKYPLESTAVFPNMETVLCSGCALCEISGDDCN